MLAVFLLCAAFALSGTEPQKETGAEQHPPLIEVVSAGLDPMEETMAAEQNKFIEGSSVEILAEKTERPEEEEALDQEVAGGTCPPGWSQYRSRCFVFINIPLIWIEAERHCLQLDANLASIHSSQEQRFVRELVRWSTGEFTRTWIGGTDAVQPFLWLWTDGSKFDFQEWASNEPNNYEGTESCLEMNYGVESRWNDVPCNVQRPFVCAKELSGC